MSPVLSTSLLENLRAISLIMARMSDATPTALTNRAVKKKMGCGVTKGTFRGVHLSRNFRMIAVGPLTFGLYAKYKARYQ